jgi:hypothetical protein
MLQIVLSESVICLQTWAEFYLGRIYAGLYAKHPLCQILCLCTYLPVYLLQYYSQYAC